MEKALPIYAAPEAFSRLDGEMPAYRAMPSRGKNFPDALVVQEIFAVHEHIKDVCRRFAKQG